MTIDLAPLKIYIFGSTKGESIVLHLPNGRWGVVDSFASSLNDPRTNPAYRLLKQQNVTEIEFLCLTHPHDDHFRGMSQLLKGFTVRQFWAFMGPDPQDIALLKTYFLAEATQTDRAILRESAAELISIFELAEQCPIRPQTVISRRSMYPVPRDTRFQVEIQGIAPTDDRAKSYKTSLMHSLFRNPAAVQAMPHAKHNMISVGLRITFGQARIILGGDVETEAWDTILQEHPPEDLVTHFVKISHHGSTTGYCLGLWEALSNNGSSPPVAALTPYKRFKLPDPVALNHIQKHAVSIHSASSRGHADRTENWRISALAKLKAASTGKMQETDTTTTLGCCEIEVDAQGKCRVIHHGPACVLYTNAPK